MPRPARHPAYDFDFDPNDPDQVKVHYNLTGWSFEQRAELAETLAERGVPHVWEGDELVVPEQIEADVDALFDELEREIGPFPVPLLDDEDDADGVTEFELDEWPVADIELLQQSLIEAEIPHRWERAHVARRQRCRAHGRRLARRDRGRRGGLARRVGRGARRRAARSVRATPTGSPATPPMASASAVAARARAELSPSAPPFGLAIRAWGVIVERAQRRRRGRRRGRRARRSSRRRRRVAHGVPAVRVNG